MLKSAIILAKIRRSNIDFTETSIWDDEMFPIENYKLNLDENEQVLISYLSSKNDYRWILSNKKLFLLDNDTEILLEELINVDVDDIKKKSSSKSENNRLNLYTSKNKYTISIEERTWHVFYDLFIFIIGHFNSKASEEK